MPCPLINKRKQRKSTSSIYDRYGLAFYARKDTISLLKEKYYKAMATTLGKNNLHSPVTNNRFPQLEEPTLQTLQNAALKALSHYTFTRNTQPLATFYPYAGLKSTIKIEKEITRLRISDILSDAPGEVLESLIHILITRAVRRKPNVEHLSRYNQYIHHPEMENRLARVRLCRSRKRLPGPVGKYFNLNESFLRINQKYFHASLRKPNLSWSPGRSRTQLGYHDSHLNLVVISRWLDQKATPLFIIDYIMYHELLHIVVRPEFRTQKRVIHSAEFKRREEQFEEIDFVREWFRRRGLY